jgi:predicted CXXCH cytochrome family protein
VGKCQAKTATKWSLVRSEPELCYGCHARKDQKKSVHTAVRQGSCLSCHDPHGSNFPGLISEPREKICLGCHDIEPLLTKPIRHAPVAEGLCLDCHDAHGSDLPASVRGTTGSEFCLKCHDARAPTGKGTPGERYRVDLSKKTVHGAFKKTDCMGCHEGGHGSDNLKLLKKAPADLCYGCHQRVDKQKYAHSAVVIGDCSVCHEPHSSDQPKLLAKATLNEVCFTCHQDDVTGRKFIHKPLEKSCGACHEPHSAPNRMVLKAGPGKAQCYSCHQQQVDTGKVKHAALERYGCTGCHDPHGTGYAYLLPQKVNALCAGCHPGQKDGQHVTTLVRAGHPVAGNRLDPRRPKHAFSCASCHNPHGSDNPKLFYYGTTAMESCDYCHGDKSGAHPELKNVISLSRPTAGDEAGVAGAGAPAPGSGEGAPEGQQGNASEPR